MEANEIKKAQHFLVSKKIARKIVEFAGIDTGSRVLEIGAGKGFITEEVAKIGCKLLAVEIDSKFESDLQNIKRKFDNFNYIIEDIKNIDFNGFDAVIGNIPFFLSEEILRKCISTKIDKVSIIVGGNFIKKIEGESLIGFMMNKFYSVKDKEKLDKKDFEPQPNETSYLIALEKKELSDLDKMLVAICLSNGKIKNALIHVFMKEGKTKNQAKELIKAIALDEDALNKPCRKITFNLIKGIEKELNQYLLGPSKALDFH
jgi:16S rRNA A1518/A1519 N6-dimethyltransferase RsmA/KsgA/DIM1 with predicted DNA glycosylase/AP lyase activity